MAGPAAAVRALAVGCALLAVAVCLVSDWGAVPGWVVVLTAAGVAGLELTWRSTGAGRPRRPSSATEVVVAACLLTSAGAWVVVAVGTGVAVASSVRRTPRVHRQLDVAGCLLGLALAQAVSTALGAGVAGAGAGTALYWLVGCLVSARAVSLVSCRPLLPLLAVRARSSAGPAAALASAGLLAGSLALEAPLGLLALGGLALLLRSAYDGAGPGAGLGVLAELARDPGRTADASAALLVTAAARLLGGADVELLVLAPAGPVVVTGDETGAAAARPAGPAALDAPWVRRALAAGGVQAGRDAARPYVTTVLGRPDRPLAVLRARRQEGTPHFDRRARRLATALGAPVEAWLGGAAPGGVGPGPAGGPDGELAAELAAVRLAAQRLAALTAPSAAGEDRLDQLVPELHALERAVTGSLGVRALARAGQPASRAARPAERRRPVPRPAAADAEWTTTGVLR